VRDSGIGIAPEQPAAYLRGLFASRDIHGQALWRHGPGPGDQQATGAADGRQLQVESELGVGSRFFFSLLVPACGHRSGVKDKYAALSISGMTRDQPLRVLVVDDNESAREVLQAMIEALGWQCDTLNSGREAL
jgi:hypothetical protein